MCSDHSVHQHLQFSDESFQNKKNFKDRFLAEFFPANKLVLREVIQKRKEISHSQTGKKIGASSS